MEEKIKKENHPKEQKKPKSLEEALQELKEITQKMENPGISLEDSFHLFREGMQLLQFCQATVDQVEKKMMVLSGDGTKKEFDPEDFV